jgi:hypothetical protein
MCDRPRDTNLSLDHQRLLGESAELLLQRFAQHRFEPRGIFDGFTFELHGQLIVLNQVAEDFQEGRSVMGAIEALDDLTFKGADTFRAARVRER